MTNTHSTSGPVFVKSDRDRKRDMTKVQCFNCKRYGHYRSECRELSAGNFAEVAKYRMREVRGSPNKAAAQVLYKLVVDEQDHFSPSNSKDCISEDECNLFETLLLSNAEPREEPHISTESIRDAALGNNFSSEDGLAETNIQVQTDHENSLPSGAKRPKELDKVPVIEDPVKCSRVSAQNVYALILKDTTVVQFEGACLDTSAYRTVVSLSRLLLYEYKYGITLKHWREPANLIFGDHVLPSLGVVLVIITTPHGPEQVKTHVVKQNIPFLIGLNVLGSLRWSILTVQNKLQSV